MGKTLKVYQKCIQTQANLLGMKAEQYLNWRPFIQNLGKRLNSVCFKMSVLSTERSVDFETIISVDYAYLGAFPQ